MPAVARPATRRATIAALLAGAVAFGGSFAVARAVSDDGGGGGGRQTVKHRAPERLVTINNLERAPTMKPLRSVAGAPPAKKPVANGAAGAP